MHLYSATTNFVKNQSYLTDSLLVNVATIAVDTTKIKQFPIKSIKSEPYVYDDYKNYLYIGLAILAFVILGIYYFFFYRKRKPQEEKIPIQNPLSPLEEVIYKLKQLDEKLLWQNNKVKEYYSELTDIVHQYLEREFKTTVLEKTTDEIMELLAEFKKQDIIETDEIIIVKLQKLFRESDLVKFAKWKPIETEIRENRKQAEEVVNNLKLKIQIKQEDELE